MAGKKEARLKKNLGLLLAPACLGLASIIGVGGCVTMSTAEQTAILGGVVGAAINEDDRAEGAAKGMVLGYILGRIIEESQRGYTVEPAQRGYFRRESSGYDLYREGEILRDRNGNLYRVVRRGNELYAIPLDRSY